MKLSGVTKLQKKMMVLITCYSPVFMVLNIIDIFIIVVNIKSLDL